MEYLPPFLLMGLRFTFVALLLVWWFPIPRGYLKKIFFASLIANTIQYKQIELNETDKKIFIIDNQLDSLNNDLSRQKININEHQKEINKSNIELKSLDENTSKKNILIIDIEKKLSLEKKLLDNLKEELDSFQIKYALEKQKRDTLLLKEAKNHEEYKETNKKIKLTILFG